MNNKISLSKYNNNYFYVAKYKNDSKKKFVFLFDTTNQYFKKISNFGFNNVEERIVYNDRFGYLVSNEIGFKKEHLLSILLIASDSSGVTSKSFTFKIPKYSCSNIAQYYNDIEREYLKTDSLNNLLVLVKVYNLKFELLQLISSIGRSGGPIWGIDKKTIKYYWFCLDKNLNLLYVKEHIFDEPLLEDRW